MATHFSDSQNQTEQDCIVVQQGGPLSGTVHISGAKNAILKLTAATLLSEGHYRFTNVPKITDITNMLNLVAAVGATYVHTPGEITDTVDITVKSQVNTVTPPELVSSIRASIQVLGPMVARAGEVTISMPGGDQIGARAIGYHLEGLKQMGATITTQQDSFTVAAPNGLRGIDYRLKFASVGATENILLAATLAQGTTVIRNAAKEPEIVDLCKMLTNMGADITGAGTSDITITGQPSLHSLPEPHHVIGDRIEAGTYLAAAVISGGDVTLRGINPQHLGTPINILRNANVSLRTSEDTIRITPSGRINRMEISTLAYPGFPTDLQAPFLVLLSCALGESLMSENVFENRFGVVSQLINIGFNMKLVRPEGYEQFMTPGYIPTEEDLGKLSTVTVRRGATLSGGQVFADDIRAGAALVLAGLRSEHPTEVFNVYHIDRGYADFVPKLQNLGANIQRTTRMVL